MTFAEIFAEYYANFRGQATNIPTYGDPEFTLATQLGNNSIRKWDRADGQLWRELITTASEDDSGDLLVSTGLFDYAAPTNMRKPPAFVRFTSGGSYFDIPVSEPQNALNDAASNSSIVWFSGSANSGYTMWIGAGIATEYNGYSVDYPYVKKPDMLPTDSDPSNVEPDMSDPNFMIQDMLAARFTISKNGFGVNVAKREATLALANMKLENNSGMYGNSESLGTDSGWGVPSGNIGDIKLNN
jgi:hypothetical protein